MMIEDEPLPKKMQRLDEMSIDGLKERIAALKDEIALCEAQITKKEASRKAADAAFFKS